ncbi:MAG: response regulator [Candidatus Nanopelagicales bacterium]|jgi:DNA-binding response OmpR family regulator
MGNATILVVDDDQDVLDIVRLGLEADGFSVIEAMDGESAITAFESHRPSAVVLDVGIGRPNGIEVCRYVRGVSAVPIIMLTARRDEVDELVALAAGADDYVTKPFSPRVLAARLSVRLEHRVELAPSEVLRFRNLALDLEARSVTVDGVPIGLTRTEFEILALLLGRPRRVFTRAEMIDAVWSQEWFGDYHLVETHTSRMRRKIVDAGGPRVAIAVRGVGYRLAEDLEQLAIA